MYFVVLLYMLVGMCFKVTQGKFSLCEFVGSSLHSEACLFHFIFDSLFENLILFSNYVKCDSKVKPTKQVIFK